MSKIRKTNAARLLDKAKISYELVSYTIDPDDLSAEHVTQQLGVEGKKVFKTLVLEGDRAGYFVCVMPGLSELDLKKAAKVSHNKRCEMISQKLLYPLTGYIRGGCSPIGMKKTFPTFLDETAIRLDKIYISAGQQGLQICLSPFDLVQMIQATIAPLTAVFSPNLSIFDVTHP